MKAQIKEFRHLQHFGYYDLVKEPMAYNICIMNLGLGLMTHDRGAKKLISKNSYFRHIIANEYTHIW